MAERAGTLTWTLRWSGISRWELDLIGQIAEALSESNLPYKVDIVDLAVVDPEFRARVAVACIALPVSPPLR
jgi:hypothetical protein